MAPGGDVMAGRHDKGAEPKLALGHECAEEKGRGAVRGAVSRMRSILGTCGVLAKKALRLRI